MGEDGDDAGGVEETSSGLATSRAGSDRDGNTSSKGKGGGRKVFPKGVKGRQKAGGGMKRGRGAAGPNKRKPFKLKGTGSGT